MSRHWRDRSPGLPSHWEMFKDMFSDVPGWFWVVAVALFVGTTLVALGFWSALAYIVANIFGVV